MRNSLHYFGYKLGLAPAQTQTSSAEIKTIIKFAQGKKRLAEIGVFHGVNTLNMRKVMSSHAILIAIDPFCRSFFGIRGYGWARRIAHSEVAKSRNGNVIWIEDFGKNAPLRSEVAKLLPVDFLFIDGDHSWDGLKGDWESWSGCIQDNGIVALHDSQNSGNCGSEKYTKQVILRDPRFKQIAAVDTLTVLQRIE